VGGGGGGGGGEIISTPVAMPLFLIFTILHLIIKSNNSLASNQLHAARFSQRSKHFSM
jgi:hypothetical protein